MKRLTLLCMLALASCVSPNAADEARYKVIGPEYRAYVEADPALDATQKQRRLDLVEAWRMSVEAGK